ncbi:hypothetical protein [Virgibacillus dokdonensis]|uniref:Uncharacterized protein n=1 Tax=Virgibacillus dokdonensis TaxID=302167 RepID=A0A2K9ITQ9_9BACI|nr:hypothetical protein [Virgibacillus dokdonensis]AUJ23147.1 hypothetical protein A21D_00031 [Virgibacillus dokdonensis]
MQTLDAPVFEVRQDSDWYKEEIERREKTKEFFNKIQNGYIQDNGFAFYHESHFGIYADSKDYEIYKSELTKHPDKNGIYTFKKRSTHYKLFKEMLDDIPRISPFKPHDVFGLNNMNQSQWVGDRWFYSVKDENKIPQESIGIKIEPISYKKYLEIIVGIIEDNEGR